MLFFKQLIKQSVFATVLLSIFALFLLVSGCESEQDKTSQTFKESLRPVAEQAAGTIAKASETVARCNDYAQSSKVNGPPSLLTQSPSSDQPNKTGEMEACSKEISQDEDAIKKVVIDLQTMTPPAGCDKCQGAADSLNAALSDSSLILAQEKESLLVGAAILRIVDDELSALKAAPQLGEEMTEEELKEFYSSMAAIYMTTLEKWNALAVPVSFSESIKGVVTAKQAQFDAVQQEADTGPSPIVEIQMELSSNEVNAGMQAMKAVQSAYGVVKKKLTDLEARVKEDKSAVDEIVSSLSSPAE
ncbi:MAG: hypothetical protein Q7K29_08465 [Thermoleophilia bacterium]|nr:hypothetical protein [Thermoleophilia bacterium]